MNKNVILLTGLPGSGKTTSLSNLSNVLYLNCEGVKRVPFNTKNKNWEQYDITDPKAILNAINYAEEKESINYIVIDSLVFLMEMFELKCFSSRKTFTDWEAYKKFFEELMFACSQSSKSIIILAHNKQVEQEDLEMSVPVKGSLKDKGVEAYFDNICVAKIFRTDELKQVCENSLLSYDEDEEELNVKYVLKVKRASDNLKEKVRFPKGMWNKNETYINSDIQLVIDRINDYYS